MGDENNIAGYEGFVQKWAWLFFFLSFFFFSVFSPVVCSINDLGCLDGALWGPLGPPTSLGEPLTNHPPSLSLFFFFFWRLAPDVSRLLSSTPSLLPALLVSAATPPVRPRAPRRRRRCFHSMASSTLSKWLRPEVSNFCPLSRSSPLRLPRAIDLVGTCIDLRIDFDCGCVWSVGVPAFRCGGGRRRDLRFPTGPERLHQPWSQVRGNARPVLFFPLIDFLFLREMNRVSGSLID